jgi:hypothetical protein
LTRTSDHGVGVLLNAPACAVDDAATACLESTVTAMTSAEARQDRAARLDWDLAAFHEACLRREAAGLGEFARQEGVSGSHASGRIKRAFLAPDIPAAIMNGRQPA